MVVSSVSELGFRVGLYAYVPSKDHSFSFGESLLLWGVQLMANVHFVLLLLLLLQLCV